ncbi:MAG: response regulator transcription factor [Deltaproteobacteria bacterium]|nr:MAG: response regulator transcription factor [Deltaproteobacteria bacterium]
MSETALISIVDDDESMREAIQSLLRSVGFRAKTFASGEQFLQSDQIENTACLILDVRMPGMSGLDLQRRLMATQCRIPIVFVTAHGEEEARSRALQEGAVDFLLKPFSEEALLNAIQAALHAH